jgi:hypothetical protein
MKPRTPEAQLSDAAEPRSWKSRTPEAQLTDAAARCQRNFEAAEVRGHGFKLPLGVSKTRRVRGRLPAGAWPRHPPAGCCRGGRDDRPPWASARPDGTVWPPGAAGPDQT